MTERFISVDIETSGPVVGKHSLVSIGACLCDNVSTTFRRDIVPISAEAEPAAMQIVGHSLEHFTRTGNQPADAFAALRDWVNEIAGDAQPVFVGFNAAFDWAFVNWYFLTYVGENPFGIAPLDIKAYYAGFAGSSWDETRSSRIDERFKAVREHTHDPLDDAIEQALMFNRIREAAQSVAKTAYRDGAEGQSNGLSARLHNLRRIANQQSSMHAVLRDRYDAANFVLTIASLIPTAALLCLVLVSDDFAQRAFGFSPDHFKLFNAAVVLFAFVCILIQLVWKPDTRAAAHAHAVEHYANAKYDAGRLLDSTAALELVDVKAIEDKYLDVRGLPPIRDASFNWLKQRHLRKLDLSKRLDKDPWISLPWLGRRLKPPATTTVETGDRHSKN